MTQMTYPDNNLFRVKIMRNLSSPPLSIFNTYLNILSSNRYNITTKSCFSKKVEDFLLTQAVQCHRYLGKYKPFF